MKTKKLFMLMLVAGVMFSLSSCDRAIRKIVDTALEDVLNHDYKDSEKLGPVVTRDIESGNFTKIITHGAVKVEVAQDSVCRLQVYGNEKSVENYDIVVEDGVVASQTVGSADYVHGNVLRAWKDSEVFPSCKAGDTLAWTVEAKASEGQRIVALICREGIVDNVALCPAGGSVGYQYEE